eukprot:1099771-Pyramimonas_sp.AAC.1
MAEPTSSEHEHSILRFSGVLKDWTIRFEIPDYFTEHWIALPLLLQVPWLQLQCFVRFTARGRPETLQ